MRVLLALALLFLSPGLARADMDAARQAYADGRWQVAAAQGQIAGGPEGYAFAAGALIAQLMVEPDHAEREVLADRALELAEYGYQLDRENLQARLRLAGALGFKGRYLGSWRAYITRVPQRGRRLLEEIVAEDPGNAWAVGMLGVWHLEVARRGGNTGMRALDASIDAGIGYLSNAIALDPHNPAPRYFLAVSLLALDDPVRREMAIGQIKAALSVEARDAFERGIQAEARSLQALLDDRHAATAWAEDRMRR